MTVSNSLSMRTDPVATAVPLKRAPGKKTHEGLSERSLAPPAHRVRSTWGHRQDGQTVLALHYCGDRRPDKTFLHFGPKRSASSKSGDRTGRGGRAPRARHR